MAQPTQYQRGKDFAQDAGGSTDHNAINAELDAIAATLDQIRANLGVIQRDDTKLLNGSVHKDSFSAAALALIASTWTPQGTWATVTAYVVGDLVEHDPGTGAEAYVCTVAHTSGTFSTDHAAGNWTLVGPEIDTIVTAFAKTFLDDPDGPAVLTTLGFSAFAKTLIDDADAATARTTLGVRTVSGDGVLAPHKNLVCKQVTVTTVDIDADELVLTDSSGTQHLAAAVNLTLNITTNGANGLDTGLKAPSTWYHLWVIYDGTTVAGLLSASATAPTMPSGYTYKGYVGAVYNDSGSNLIAIKQKNSLVTFASQTALSNGTATAWTSVSLSAIVPPTAASVTGIMEGTNSSGATQDMIVRLASTNGGFGEQRAREDNVGDVATTESPFVGLPLIESQTIYYLATAVNRTMSIYVTGWEF